MGPGATLGSFERPLDHTELCPVSSPPLLPALSCLLNYQSWYWQYWCLLDEVPDVDLNIKANLQLFLLLVLSIIAKPDSVVKHREEDELAVPHQLESFRKGISRKTRPFPIGGIASTMCHLFFLLFTETREVGIGTKWSNVIRNGQRHSKVLTLRISDTDQGQKRPPSVEEHKSV